MINILRRIIQEISSSKNLDEALNIIVSRSKELTHADSCSIFLVDNMQGEYVLMATDGLDNKLVKKLKFKFGTGLIGHVALRAEPCNIGDTIQHPQFCHYDNLTKEAYHAFLGIPIIHQRELQGVLVAQSREPNSFDESAEAALITLSAQLAGAIAMAKSAGTIFQTKKIPRSGIILDGTPCVSGVAIGKAVVIYPTADLESVPDKHIDNPKKQFELFKKALKATSKEITILIKKVSAHTSKEQHLLFEAYLQLLDSTSLKNAVYKEIRSGNWAQAALKHAIKELTSQFETMDDEYLRERALDIKDLGQRILNNLQEKAHKKPVYPDNTILVGEQITPSELAEAPEEKIVGIVSFKGAVNSHLAILARALNLPTVMGISNETAITQLDDKEVIIDGYYGQVYVSPKKTIKKEFTELAQQEQELNSELATVRDLPAETTDGYSINLLVNTGLAVDVGHSLTVGAQGVGLYRTEVPFMVRDRFPTEDEQRVIYQQLLKVFAPRPVIMRTLDIGGDKTLPYFPVKEDNPYLGWRGIRVTLDHPEIFLIQLRAMLRANIGLNNLRIMLPMITSITEVEEAQLLINQAYEELLAENYAVTKPQVGIMVEVPSAVYLAQDLARRVDFMSVGSNDLTQYILAVDRNNSQVSNIYNSLHPAVLKALIQVVISAHREQKEVSICGEMAGDPAAIILLLAIGFDALSMNANQLLRAKWLIRNFSMEKALQLLEDALIMDDAIEIRYILEAALEEAGLAGLIRAGK